MQWNKATRSFRIAAVALSFFIFSHAIIFVFSISTLQIDYTYQQKKIMKPGKYVAVPAPLKLINNHVRILLREHYTKQNELNFWIKESDTRSVGLR
jgi:uncharacterized protein with PQ loop repeat